MDRGLCEDDRGGPSSTIATVLLVGVVVVAVVVVGAQAFGAFSTLFGAPAPAASFDATYDAQRGTVVVTHQSGDAIRETDTDRLAVRVTDVSTGYVEVYNWTDVAGSFPIEAGDSVSIEDVGGSGSADVSVNFPFERGDTVELVWHAPNGRSAPLPEFTVGEGSGTLDRYAPGIRYEYYEASTQYSSLPNFGTETPTATGVRSSVDVSPRQRGDEFAFRYVGYVKVPEDGQYTFETRSDDGSEVYVDGTRVVDNRGLHAPRTRSGTVTLDAGFHRIVVTHFEHTGGEVLELYWDGPGFGREVVPGDILYHDNDPVAGVTATCAGLTCDFDASSTQSPAGSPQSYRFEFGDGATKTSNDPTVSHTYSSPGTYTVTLTVTGPTGATDTVTETVTVDTLRPADSPGPTNPGLEYEYYEASGEYTSLPNFGSETPVKTGTTPNVDISLRERGTDYAFRYTGYVEVPQDGKYTFYTASDDGSRLFVGSERVVDNPGLHGRNEESGTIDLAKGKHEVTVVMFEHHGQEVLDVYWEGPGFGKEPIPDSDLSH